MGLLEIILLAVALAMDCFTVSIVSGVIMRRTVVATALRMALLFGLFQALMPLLGWLMASRFSAYVETYDHWVAFALLAFLGTKMIKDSFGDEEHQHFDPSRLSRQLLLAVATSIDALAVGISFACIGYGTIGSLLLPLIVIGLCSFLLSIVGNVLGAACGKSIVRRLKPELVGGAILIAIGLRILYEHLFC